MPPMRADATWEGPWRIDCPVQAMDLSPPPCDVQCWPVDDDLDVVTLPGRLDRVMAWLQEETGARTTGGRGIAASAGVARSLQPPRGWRRLAAAVDVDRMRFSSAGTATLFVSGAMADVESATAGLDAPPETVKWRPAMTGRAPILSRPQQEAMQLAVALGYYDTPRRIRLRGLAARLGMSHSALSETLRRGERLVVTAFCDDWSLQARPVGAVQPAGVL